MKRCALHYGRYMGLDDATINILRKNNGDLLVLLQACLFFDQSKSGQDQVG